MMMVSPIPVCAGAVNRQWEDLALAFVGDQFDHADDICGVQGSPGGWGGGHTLSPWIKRC